MKLPTVWGRSARGAVVVVALAGVGMWSCSSGSGSGSPATGGAGGSSGAGSGEPTPSSTGGSGSGVATGVSSSSGGTGGANGAGNGGGTGGGSGSGASASNGSGSGSGVSTGASGASSSGGSSAAGGDAGNQTGTASSSGQAGGAGSGANASSTVAFASDRVVVTGVKGTATPAATTVINLHNGGTTTETVSALAITGTSNLTLTPSGAAVGVTSTPVTGAALFQIVNPPTMPMTLAAGADLPVTVQVLTTAANLPAAQAAPAGAASSYDGGSTLLGATLTATLGSGSAVASVYGLVLIQDNYEATLGQILITLGYKLNVGQAQNNWNPNKSMDATTLPAVESGTDEVAAQHFVKAGTGNVTMTVVARFSPEGILPFGYYTVGTTKCPSPALTATSAVVSGTGGCTTVGTMSMVASAQTSNSARMVYPPVSVGSSTTYTPGNTISFDPGTAAFGIWVYSDQSTNNWQEGGKATNGDYDYSDNALNIPAPSIYRFKSYPLKDATGTAVPNTYLVAIEEAANGDYQDYVFTLSNVSIAP